jgi:hypothetical protein
MNLLHGRRSKENDAFLVVDISTFVHLSANSAIKLPLLPLTFSFIFVWQVEAFPILTIKGWSHSVLGC